MLRGMESTNAALEIEIRDAVSNGQLFLEYQPIVSLPARTVVGAEALLRWNHASGVRYPASFLPAIEQSDVMHAVARWVLNSACAQLAQWRADGRDLNVSVNITPRQLVERPFLLEVQRMLEQHRIPRNRLMLEITENSVLSRKSAASPWVRELQALGVRIALDDLGAGFNTAIALQALATDTVKIDGALVTNAHRNAWHAQVLGGILTICRRLGLQQIIEGVELEEQHTIVERFDAELAQGYLYGRPVPCDEFARLHF